MLFICLFAIALLQNACTTIHIGDVSDFETIPIRISCAESNDLNSSTESVVSCVFENISESTQSIKIGSVEVHQSSSRFLALSPAECKFRITKYFERQGINPSLIAAGAVTAVGAATHSNKTAVIAAGSGAAVLAEMNEHNKNKILLNEFEDGSTIIDPFDMAPRSNQIRRGLFPYGIIQRGSRGLVFCLASSDECIKAPLNNATVLRQRG